MEFWKELKRNSVLDLSAQLAFYFLFMVIPFMIFTLSLLSYLPLETKNALYIMTRYFPSSSAGIVRTELKDVLEHRSHLIPVVFLSLLATTNGIHAIIRALNKIYNINETRSFWKIRGLAIVIAVMMMLVIVLQLLIPTLGTAVILFAKHHLPSFANYVDLINTGKWILGFLVVYIAVWCIYRFAPCKLPSSFPLHIGVCVTSIGWQVTSYIFSFYLTHFSQYNLTYGTLGALIMLMAWFYAIGFFLLFGSSVNAYLYKKTSLKH
ncbi:hypothetical protein CN918_32180 [Priestia megaterium]|nr:hypothetical protein CN918_32180 [Priestia megaterium]